VFSTFAILFDCAAFADFLTAKRFDMMSAYGNACQK
jgi:hypothetical protein